MRNVGGEVHFSASDLMGHLYCRYLTTLDLAVAKGEIKKPYIDDPIVEVLAERGNRHEQGYVDHLAAEGKLPKRIAGFGIDAVAVSETLNAMKSGAPVIVQGALQSGRWGGRVDVLRRVELPSGFGAWSYEVVDTKLAQETKGGTVLQISLYSHLLGDVQNTIPEFAHVIVPETEYKPQTFRIADYAAYYRQARKSLEQAVDNSAGPTLYPEPNPHCEVCRWRLHCNRRRRADDHLSFVAGISKSQINELARHGVTTTEALVGVSVPWPWKPERGAAQSFEKIREQARLQVQGRVEGRPIYELLPVTPGFGLTILPEPSDGDVFFDFEGDPFVAGGGLEFLFGYAFRNESGESEYVEDWSFTRAEEKAAFERFIDFIFARLEKHPGLHIYHFAPYEPAALKRLMGRYATREDEVDHLLRSGIFVDLYSVVRNGIRASVESYSIKKLEPLYSFVRQADLADAGAVMAKVQACLELNDVPGITSQDRAMVNRYNRDDCQSAWALRDWLEGLRQGVIKAGTEVPRPVPKSNEISEDLSDRQNKVEALIELLTKDVPIDVGERSREQQARWLLAHVLDWHRREEKAGWWEFFRLAALSAEELMEERAGLSGLEFLATVGGTSIAPVHRYRFPLQETELRGGEDLKRVGGENFGTVEEISVESRTVDIKKNGKTAAIHAIAVFAHKLIGANVQAAAIMRIADHVSKHGMTGPGPYAAARDLLMVAGPRVGGQPLTTDNETTLQAAVRIAPLLTNGVFPIQGPPGAGKTHTGARMIQALAAKGKKLGITANSHKVIRNILDDVLEAAAETGVPIECIQKVPEKAVSVPGLAFTIQNPPVLKALAGSCSVAGATAWFWARPDVFEKVDVLFIDEAAQMSLANVLAVSQAAKTIVLLGDPRQLEQPIQGSHPDGTDVSALQHILGEHATIPKDRGLFLEETWRLHPDICKFTSELFYEDRLKSRPGLEQQVIRSKGRFRGSGLRYLLVSHEGNQSSSPEEAEAIKALVEEILDAGSTWTNPRGVETPLTLNDILIIAPYNAQVFELQDRLPGARIGTVDRFQGQEAPIVIYSMTTSSHADAPRGMDFLYSSNRLNVATSRARCLCILVSSPLVFEAECRTPHQMQLANAFCRYLEMAHVLDEK